MKTRTGGFPIGFRRGSSDWQQDLPALIAWAQSNDLNVIDLGRDGDTTLETAVDAGMTVGSVDLVDWKGMISPDLKTRAATIKKNADYIEACTAHGPMHFFLVMLPEDPSLARRENFEFMMESFSELVPVLEAADSDVVIEGWPGPGALCCTPETFRAFFDAVPSKAMAINYDPSHLIRMGIDPIRFLKEFGLRVTHVHGKDTVMMPENVYEYGREQPATFVDNFSFGAYAWRYTIPGQGQMRWVKTFELLDEMGYQGTVSIELEDARFNGTEAGEKAVILNGARFLAGC
jgi:sugar phosphate isomerase/epimerase